MGEPARGEVPGPVDPTEAHTDGMLGGRPQATTSSEPQLELELRASQGHGDSEQRLRVIRVSHFLNAQRMRATNLPCHRRPRKPTNQNQTSQDRPGRSSLPLSRWFSEYLVCVQRQPEHASKNGGKLERNYH